MTASPTDDRRRLERVQFNPPVPARIDGMEARLLDAGLLGALARHEEPLLVGSQVQLEFTSDGEPIVYQCRVTRCELQPILSQARGERIFFSGLEFLSGEGNSSALLKRMIAEQVSRTLEAQKANLHGATALLADAVPFLTRGETSTRRAMPATYVSCRLLPDGTWKKTVVARPTQPLDGFTMKLGDTEDEIEKLCLAYAEASPEVRKLIRLCAEMSTTDDQPLPPKKTKR